jgi:methylated-DNA-[protein]-cysteine S-methyltransferase
LATARGIDEAGRVVVLESHSAMMTPTSQPARRRYHADRIMRATRCRTIDSPIGVRTLAGDVDALTHLRMHEQTREPPYQHSWAQDQDAFPDVVAQLGAYFAGELTDFDVTLRLEGTVFQQRVWNALLEIPYGETRSYGELAKCIGRPEAPRAVGLANGRNPIAVIVPCHRVIGSDGSLTGYGGGLHRKRALLEHERDRRVPPARRRPR